jgi:serine/threonine protein kinase
MDETESRSFPQLAPRTILENRYLLGRVLGQGGFGITYIAKDLKEDRKLALKEYFPSSFATRVNDRRTVTYAGPGNREPYQYGLKKFEEEAKTLLNFQSHPNIVTVFRSFKANGTGYIVMEYLEGITLLSHLKNQRDSRLSFENALQILIPIMDALREVHRAKMIHRDISPDNVYLCRSGRIKLLDFGAARLALRDQTQSQQLILKPGYTPEEQYRSAGVAGAYTDIYSLAATMYRCITGKVPPEAPERLSEDRLVPPSQFAKLPARAEKALMKALAVRAKDRHQTMEAFQEDLSLRGPTMAGALPTQRPSLWPWLVLAAVLCAAGIGYREVGAFGLFWLGSIIAMVAIVRFAASKGSDTPKRSTPSPPPRCQFSLHCSRGDLAGNSLEVRDAPIVFGRLPDKANVVLALGEVSGVHLRAWADESSRGVWIEDLHSRNGTYVRRAGMYEWSRLEGRALLAKGDRFYLAAQDLALFEIEANE